MALQSGSLDAVVSSALAAVELPVQAPASSGCLPDWLYLAVLASYVRFNDQ